MSATNTPSHEYALSNDALLAEMDGLGEDLGKGPPADTQEADTPAEAEEAPAEAEAEGPAEETEEEVEEEKAEEEEKPEEPADPVAAKRIEAIQKAEKRSKEVIDQHRLETERLIEARKAEIEREWRPKVEAYEKQQKLLERITTDPLAFAEEQKWDKETKLYWAEQMFLDAKGADDPKYKAQATQRLREREVTSKTSHLEKQLAEMNAKFERLEEERRTDAYLGKATAAVTEKTPVLKAMLEKKPDVARERIKQAFAYIRQQTGQDPDPADVITKLEEVERHELIVRGIDPDAIFKPKVATKTKTQDAGEKQTAMKNGKSTTKPPPKPPATPAEVSNEQLIKELEEMESRQRG